MISRRDVREQYRSGSVDHHSSAPHHRADTSLRKIVGKLFKRIQDNLRRLSEHRPKNLSQEYGSSNPL
jgi:hypothetical protein